jgi:hypothetical protein
MVEAEDLAEAIRVMGEVLRDGGTTVEPIAAAEATRSATRESLAASAPTTAAR